MKVVVIDDDADIRSLLRIALEMHGHEAILFSRVLLALESRDLAEADFIILDIAMPEISGMEFLNAYNKPPHQKVIAYTASGSRLKEEAIRKGADFFCGKGSASIYDEIIPLMAEPDVG